TNAGVIGASRITYAMASYRQIPGAFRRLHPKFKTPWLSLVVFAGIASIAVLLPGQVNFLGDLYAFGAMLSFTIAHVSIIALRAPVLIGPAVALEYRSILVPVKPGRMSQEAVDVACRLAAERRASIAAVAVVTIPLELPLATRLEEEEERANEVLDGARAIGE